MIGYIVKEEGGKLLFSTTKVIEGPFKLDSMKIKVLRELQKKAQYPSELAKKLKVNEQNIYYHIKQLMDEKIVYVAERKEVRGTIAKKLKPAAESITFCIKEPDKPIKQLVKQDKDDKLSLFLEPFIKDGRFAGDIIVGNPDPHGPFKARARDGHYATDLAYFLGNHSQFPERTVTKLDTGISLKTHFSPLIIVGGPVTNQIVGEINSYLPVKFSDKKPWGLYSEKTHKNYTDDSIGIIARIPNPHFSENKVLVFAGIRYSGTKAAVLALIKENKLILSRFGGQKRFSVVVQGFDMDGDSEIDSIEVLE